MNASAALVLASLFGTASQPSAPKPQSPPAADAAVHRCELSDDRESPTTFVVELPPVAGFTPGPSDEGCSLIRTQASGQPDSQYTILVVHQDDSGPEQLLKLEPDGVRQWGERLVKDLKVVKEGSAPFSEVKVPYFLVRGTMGGVTRQVALARTRQDEHHVVLIAMLPPKPDADRQVRDFMRGVRVQRKPQNNPQASRPPKP